MTDDSAKKAILARRARFIAAAMMGAGLVSCDRKSAEPSVCLSVSIPPPDAPPPQPCLSVAIVQPVPSDGTGMATDGGADDAGARDAGARPPPVPCLSPMPPPRPCLSKVPSKPSVCLSFPF